MQNLLHIKHLHTDYLYTLGTHTHVIPNQLKPVAETVKLVESATLFDSDLVLLTKSSDWKRGAGGCRSPSTETSDDRHIRPRYILRYVCLSRVFRG